MKCLIVLCTIVGITVGGRLDSGYIPPAHNSNLNYQNSQHGLQSHGPTGGAYSHLKGGQQQGRSYNAPQQQYQQPQQQYQQPQQQYQQPQQQYQQPRQYQQPQQQYQSGPPIPILEYENNPNNGDGSYSFRYVTGNGISHQEEGHHTAFGPEQGTQTVTGQYSYTADDGTPINLSYTADENGFHPVGDHLPTPPPIPEEILESLKLTAPGYDPKTAGFGPSVGSGGQASGFRNYQQPAYNAPKPASPGVSSFQSASTFSGPQGGRPSAFGRQNSFNSGFSSPSGQTQGFNSVQRIPGGISVQSGQSSFSSGGQPAFASYGSGNAPKSTYLPPP